MYAQILKKLNDLEAEIKLSRFPLPQLLTLSQASKVLRLSEKTVKKLIAKGELSAPRSIYKQ